MDVFKGILGKAVVERGFLMVKIVVECVVIVVV
jgi:hypothetical protein